MKNPSVFPTGPTGPGPGGLQANGGSKKFSEVSYGVIGFVSVKFLILRVKCCRILLFPQGGSGMKSKITTDESRYNEL